MISMIAAVTKNNVLADEHGIPWQGTMPADVAYFRQKTLHKKIVMGWRMYQELDAPLPDRENFVLSTRRETKVREGFKLINSVDDVLSLNDDEIMIVGGGKTYDAFLPFAQKLYLTYIDADYPGTVFFPEVSDAEWQKIKSEKHQADDQNTYNYEFVVLERKV